MKIYIYVPKMGTLDTKGPLELVEAFKPHFKKSDVLKWRQLAFKLEKTVILLNL